MPKSKYGSKRSKNYEGMEKAGGRGMSSSVKPVAMKAKGTGSGPKPSMNHSGITSTAGVHCYKGIAVMNSGEYGVRRKGGNKRTYREADTYR